MAKIIRPVFGKPCRECGEQIEQARIRVNPQAVRCFDCASAKEERVRSFQRCARPQDVEIIRG
ncbi:TraR/DksA C4-type zinc finger protein [Mesorhizobium sp. BR1-1-16]|uniref:TraR/DksA C4-type zinc finger protein n=1 Tax=Mesorhizobium sp. BR1-1-16 TaxID=2876653 RepID=UPI001CCAD4B5|nr:TraR/DksA C4-type zinc finger protein [Mesorhizobium sp. BR1-1-16]MBZ9939155.1 TraR/DksA C4-type zinc finger protein [Mesorhizobium sp. BR1-1-16]